MYRGRGGGRGSRLRRHFTTGAWRIGCGRARRLRVRSWFEPPRPTGAAVAFRRRSRNGDSQYEIFSAVEDGSLDGHLTHNAGRAFALMRPSWSRTSRTYEYCHCWLMPSDACVRTQNSQSIGNASHNFVSSTRRKYSGGCSCEQPPEFT